MTQNIQLLPITTQASPYWDSLVRIYRESFPINEQRPVESIARLITEEPRYTLYAVIDDDADTKGASVATTEPLGSPRSTTLTSFSHPEGTLNPKHYTLNTKQPIGLLTTWEFTDFTYIEHFAIDPEMRSKGYGSKTMKTFIRQQEKHILLEAESPTNELTRRRIRFYERQGLALYDFPYMQPAYTEESQPVELHLMGTVNTHTTPLTHVSNTLHREVYKCR